MTLLPREESFIQTVVTTLRGIATTATPTGDSNPYLNDVAGVYRYYFNPNDLEKDELPALWVSPSAVADGQMPGAQIDNEITLVLGGVIREERSRTKKADSDLPTDLMKLWSDVRRAIYQDITFGGAVIWTRVNQSEFDEGVAYPLGWFVVTMTSQLRYPANTQLVDV